MQNPRRTIGHQGANRQPRSCACQKNRDARFLDEAPLGPIKRCTLRGIKDSPPYLHDGRCLTLEDTIEFFNPVLELNLTKPEKADLVALMRQL